jgi:hypothetical protein
MKTNIIRNEIELHKRIEKLEEENIKLKEQVNDCIDFIRVLEQWFKDTEENNCIDMGTY